MAPDELESFFFKFRNLWKAGQEATLNVKTKAGQAWVTLEVNLGAPQPHQAQRQHCGSRVSASQNRRLQRRAENRKLGKDAKEASEAIRAESEIDNKSVDDEAAEKATKAAKATTRVENKAEEAIEDELCTDREYFQIENKTIADEHLVKCSVDFFPDAKAILEDFQNSVFNYFKLRSDLISKVMACDISKHREKVILVIL